MGWSKENIWVPTLKKVFAEQMFLHVSPPVLGVFSFVHKVMNGFHW